MSPLKLVVTDQAFGNTEQEQAAATTASAAFSSFQCTNETEASDAVAGANVILNNFAPMTRKVMVEMAPDATIIRYGVGVDNVDLEAAKDLGVRVCNIPDYGVEEVADHAAATALFLARKINQFDAGIRDGKWKIAETTNGLRSLRDTTVGLVGFGRIAQSLARRMQAFGCTIVAYDPFIDKTIAKDMKVQLMPLDDVVAVAEILSLHVPLLPETRHMVNSDRIDALPNQPIVINTSRGGLIDEDALAVALASGRVSAAGLDVFETEPLPLNSPLRTAPNVYLSPHAAFFSDASVHRLQQLASEEAIRALRGEPLRCPVV